jgi:hypothetical protein
MECGGSSHRLPALPHTGNGQEPKLTSASPFRDGDADERLLLIDGKAMAAAAALQGATRTVGRDSTLDGRKTRPYIPEIVRSKKQGCTSLFQRETVFRFRL